MSKVLDATCNTQIVTADNLPVDAEILSEGVAPSSGIAIIEKGKVYYLTSNASDIKSLIENLGSTLDQVITILSGIDAVTTSPGSQAANIAVLSTLKATLVAQKDLLK